MAEYFSLLVKYLPLLLKGLQYTIIIAIGGIILGTILGIILCILSISKFSVLQKIANFYVTIVRGIPLMILALFLYFGVIKNALPVLTSAIIILGINASAFIAEIFRAGIQAIDPGQMEAGRAVGLSFSVTMIKIVIPQAVKNILPTLGNEFIALVKETSVVSFVGAADLYVAFNYIGTNSYEFMVPYLVMALIYIVIVLLISLGIKLMERSLKKSDRRN